MKHLLEFDDESANATGKRHDGITISYMGNESLKKMEVEGIPFISGNSAGLLKLGEILVQMGLSNYKSGFHLQIREDFDADKNDLFIIGLNKNVGD